MRTVVMVIVVGWKLRCDWGRWYTEDEFKKLKRDEKVTNQWRRVYANLLQRYTDDKLYIADLGLHKIQKKNRGPAEFMI